MVGRIDVENSRELQATLLALRAAPREVQANVRRYTRDLLLPEFRRGMAERATASRVQQRVLVDSASIRMSNQNVRMRAGTSRRRLSGGLVPASRASAFEFGSARTDTTTYERKASLRRPKRKGGGQLHKVTRNTHRQMPRFRRKGWAFYPTVEALFPRFASLWVQTSIRTVLDAIDARR